MLSFIPISEVGLVILILIFIVGLLGLIFGGNWLTEGAAGAALNLKVNPVVVGLTVVSIATSMPELLASMLSAATGSPGLAIGNILGSNIANIGLILGVAGIICPMIIAKRIVRKDVPVLLGITALFWIFCIGGLSRIEGLILLALAGTYIFILVRESRQMDPDQLEDIQSELPEKPLSMWACAGFVLIGTILLAIGADLMVQSSVEMAQRFGVSDVLIGITVVAIGTSLPELAAAIAAAAKKHIDLIAGNVVGSNVFNMLLIGGGVSSVFPLPIQNSLHKLEFPGMFAMTILLWVLAFMGHKIRRPEAIILLLAYGMMITLSVVLQGPPQPL